MKPSRFPQVFFRLNILLVGLFTLTSSLAKADSINFFIDFLNTDSISTISALSSGVDGNLDDTIDQTLLNSLMVSSSGQADSFSFTSILPEHEHDVRYFSYDLPSNVITELGLGSGSSSAVMNFSGVLTF
jgi:hypothetical protein